MSVIGYVFMVLAGLASLALPVLGVIGLVAFFRRGHVLGRDTNESLGAAVLDGLDQVHVRLDAVNDRLARVERLLESGDMQSLAAPESDEARPERSLREEPDDAGG